MPQAFDLLRFATDIGVTRLSLQVILVAGAFAALITALWLFFRFAILGKILRATMRKIADREDWKMPATIDDPAILGEITIALKAKGLAG